MDTPYLVINKDGVNYGEDASGDPITDIANVTDLAEGSFLFAFENGVIIDRDGEYPNGSTPGKYVVVYSMENGLLRTCTLNPTLAKRLPSFTNTAASKVVNATLVLPTTHTDRLHTGIIAIDADKHPSDPSARKRYEVLVDGDTLSTHSSSDTAASLVAAKLQEHPKVLTATVTKSTGAIVITMVAGANMNFVGTGYFEDITFTVGTQLEFANTLSATELAELEKEAMVKEGRSQDNILGGDVANMFTKLSMVESGKTYTIYGVEYLAKLQSQTLANMPKSNLLLIASPNSTPADDDGDTGTWADLIGALYGGATEASAQ